MTPCMSVSTEPSKQGDKIAQLIIERIDTTPLQTTEKLDTTQQNAQVYGSTGTKARVNNTNDRKQIDPPANNKPEVEQPTKTHCSSCPSNTKSSMLTTELWHQRMGHIGLKKLQDTAKCTKGMPNIGKLHPLFKCRACAIAKMTKAPRGKT